MRHDSALKNLIIISAIAGNSIICINPADSLAASVDANAITTVVAPVTISTTVGPMFEKLSKGGSGGVIIVSSTGTPSANGNDVQTGHDENRNVATFVISSEGNNAYFVSLPAEVSVKDDVSHNRAIHKFIDVPYGTGLLIGDNQDLRVIGKLDAGGIQVAGNYTGNFHITVDYN